VKPLRRSVPVPPPFTQVYALCAKEGMSMEAARALYDSLKECEVWRNDLYVVHVKRLYSGEMHLSIRRDDRKPCRDWRHFQQIKNQLAGPEREAVEIYPAESRVVDAANQFHLFVLPEGDRVPMGFTEGGRRDDIDVGFGEQRPFDEEPTA